MKREILIEIEEPDFMDLANSEEKDSIRAQIATAKRVILPDSDDI